MRTILTLVLSLLLCIPAVADTYPSSSVFNPCANPATLKQFSFSAQATSFVVIPGASLLSTVVCAIHIELFAATLAATTLQSGNGTVCGSNTVTIDSFGASTGRYVPFSTAFSVYADLPIGYDLCFNVGTSVAGLFDISGTYVQQ